LEQKVEIVAHKMVAGNGIGLHNDSVPGWETHRLTVTLTRGWDDSKGGHLVFFRSQDATDVHCIFRPNHNCGVAFELVPNAFHAVSDVKSGVRYSIVFSFWQMKSYTEVPILDRISRVREYMRLKRLGDVDHSGRSLLAHLEGTFEILNRWKSSSDTCL